MTVSVKYVMSLEWKDSRLDAEAMLSGRSFHNLMARGNADELKANVSPYILRN